MSVTIVLPPVLQPMVGGAKEIDVAGGTVGACLENLIKQYPALKPKFFTGKNKLPNGISIFVNGEDAYPEPLKKPVCDGDKIYISHIVLGG